MSRKSLIPLALAALLAATPAVAQQGSSGGATSGSGSTSTSSQSDSATEKPDSAAEKPDSAAEKPDSATEKPDSATEKPDSATEKPDSAAATATSTAERAADPSSSATAKPDSASSDTPASGTSSPSASAQGRATQSATTRSQAGQAQSRTQTQARGQTQGQAGARGQRSAQGQSDASFDSTTPGAQSRTQADEQGAEADAQGRAGINTPARPGNEDVPGRATGRPDNDQLPGRAFNRTQDQADQADQDDDLETSAEAQSDLELNGPDQRRDSSPQNQQDAFDTEAGEREIRNRPSLDEQGQDDQDDFDTPARPGNEDIPGRATGRPDNDELPGRAFNRDQDQADDDARQFDRGQDRQTQDQQDADRFERRDDRQGDRQQRRDRFERQQRDRADARTDRRDRRSGAEGEARGDVDIRQRLGVDFDTSSRNRLTISSLNDDSILAAAGVQEGDVLMSVDGQRVTSMAQFNRFLADVDASARIPLIVQRDGRQQRIYLSGRELVGVYGDYGYGGNFWNQVGLRLATDAGRLVVSSITPRSYFAQYGFQPGDVIVSAYGRPVRSMDAFQSIIMDADPGARIPVAVYRDGQEETLYVTARTDVWTRETQQYATSGSSGAWLGVTLDPRYSNGAMVRSVQRGSPAQQAGVRPGDWILSVNGEEINSPDHLSEMISQMDPQETVDLEVSRRASLRLEANLEESPRSYVGSRVEDDVRYESRYNRQGGRIDYDADADYQQFDGQTGRAYNQGQGYGVQNRLRPNIPATRGTQGFENRTDDRGAFEVGDGDGRILNRDERGGVRGRIFGGNR